MTQHRVRIYEQGAPSALRYESLPAPIGAPGSGEVRLRHDAVGLNFVDTMFRNGTFDVRLPFDMGIEGAGVVEAVGADVENVKVGDRVAYFFSFGAYSDVRLIAADVLIKLPEYISTRVAAALVTKGLTAWMLLKRVHVVQPGEYVLVQGAAGGVGSLLAAWAKARGAIVIAGVGSPSKLASVKKGGIEHVLLNSDPEFGQKVAAITQGQGVHVAYEFVGKSTFRQSVSALRDGGTMAHVGSASGAPAPIDMLPITARSIRYVQPSTSQYVNDRNSLEAASGELFEAYRDKVFGEVQATAYALAEVAQAHEDLAARRITGSAILIP
ncbi:quinone oxidoreductase family protein [Undibacterium terreum]|uniref:Quinone oxidoreductase n=1 Tax=Undibacterium terreum TaxID=1224302 RepID=A0A916XKL8_9BURK|nr:quinone oxidoreductase [Undibacterium terreum]GGC81490.1 quinone oxidoreductase [Undibacterium terreum]